MPNEDDQWEVIPNVDDEWETVAVEEPHVPFRYKEPPPERSLSPRFDLGSAVIPQTRKDVLQKFSPVFVGTGPGVEQSYQQELARQRAERGVTTIEDIDLMSNPGVNKLAVTAQDLSPDPGVGSKVTAGLNQAAVGLASAVLSPLGLVGMAPERAIGQGLKRAIGASFVGPMVAQAPGQIAQGAGSLSGGNVEQGSAQLGSGLAGLALLALPSILAKKPFSTIEMGEENLVPKEQARQTTQIADTSQGPTIDVTEPQTRGDVLRLAFGQPEAKPAELPVIETPAVEAAKVESEPVAAEVKPTAPVETTQSQLPQETPKAEVPTETTPVKGPFYSYAHEAALEHSGFKSTAKLSGTQIENRLNNLVSQGKIAKLELEHYKDKGLTEWLQESPRSMEEVAQWMKGNAENVEVFKAEQDDLTPEEKLYNQLTHEWYDEQSRKVQAIVNERFYNPIYDRIDFTQLDAPLDEEKINEYIQARLNTFSPEKKQAYTELKQINQEIRKSYPGWHVSNDMDYFVSPDNKAMSGKQAMKPEPEGRSMPLDLMELANKKWDVYERFVKSEKRKQATTSYGYVSSTPEKKMQGYAELALVKPIKQGKSYAEFLQAGMIPEDVQRAAEGMFMEPEFESPHSLPKNTLGFSRGHQVTLPTGEKTWMMEEAQSDWHKDATRDLEYQKKQNPQDKTAKLGGPTILKDWERAVLKMVIQHAREKGMDSVTIADAETAMMTEGHHLDAVFNMDEQKHYIKQEKGMRLHYDELIPRLMRELTGDQGEKVEIGEHKKAEDRDDLIFRNPDGTPKTTTTGLKFSLKNVKDKQFSLFGKDAYKTETKKASVAKQPKQSPTVGATNLSKNAVTPPPKTVPPQTGSVPTASLLPSVQRSSGGVPSTTGHGSGGSVTLPAERTPSGGAPGGPIPPPPPRPPAGTPPPPPPPRPPTKFQQAMFNWWQGKDNRGDIAMMWDVTKNQANQYARQANNFVQDRAIDSLGKRPTHMQAVAFSLAREDGFDVNKMSDSLDKLKGVSGKQAEEARQGLRLALSDPRLRDLDKWYDQEMQKEVVHENSREIPTRKLPNYVPHVADVSDENAVLFDSPAGTGGGRGYTKPRVHETLVDGIAAGTKYVSLNAFDLLEHRIRAGQVASNRADMVSAMKGMTDPGTGNPVVKNLDTTQGVTVTPKGYQSMMIGNHPVAVHNGYVGLLDALTGTSLFGKDVVGRAIMQATTVAKHTVLMFDLYHPIRLWLYSAPLRGMDAFKSTRKSLLLLDNDDTTLHRMDARGELPKGMLPDLVAARRVNQIALQTGYNVNRFSDALHTDWLRKIPGIGGYNKWLFEEFQRGLMMDTYRHEFDRIKQQNPQKSDMEVGRQVSKDLNALFGNMMSQGWIKSATANDLARLFYLAPSWNMGRIASEFGGFGQAAKNVKDSAFQKRMLAGSLTKSMGTIALAYFVANQFINYLTRGQPTWENKDDYTGAKISAWIPDFMGGKSQGMWLNPMGLVAEITHQIVERAHKRKDVLAALSDVNQYKLSNFGKSAWVLATGEDWMQNHLHDWDRVKEALKQGAPVPIPANTISALVQGEEYPGQIQKQTLSSFGLKTDLKKDTAKDRLNAQKGMSWKDRVNAAKVDASERVRTDDDRVKLMATRKAAEALYDRTQELRAGLSKEMVKWLADKKLRLTGYEDRIVIQGANVQLTDEEREQYGKIMQREYSLAIQKFMQENTDKLSQQQKQARFESRLNAAKNKARTAMLKTLK